MFAAKIGEIWSYFKHRKGLFLVILALSGVVTLAGCAVLMPRRSELANREETKQLAETPMAGVYHNSLRLKILGTGGQAACELNFDDTFSRATLTLAAEDLDAAAYLRVLGADGTLLAGEQATVAEMGTEEVKYRFSDAPRAYTLELTPGAIVEVQAKEARVYSNLSGGEVGYFAPEQAVERYVVTVEGLRKEGWDEQTGEDVMYGLLASDLKGQIESYRETAAPEVVENKTLDVANKAQVKLAFYHLREVDQTEYTEFITALERGGTPEISFDGATDYRVGDEVAWRDLVTAHDNEDGEIKEVEMETNYDTNVAGEYYVTFRATDADGNTGELTQTVAVVQSEDASTESAPGTDRIEPVGEANLVAEVTEAESNVNLDTAAVGLGGGQNADEVEAAPADEETTEDPGNIIVTEDETKHQAAENDIRETKPDERSETAKDEGAGERGWNWMIWLGVGAVVLLALGKFVSDHYIR